MKVNYRVLRIEIASQANKLVSQVEPILQKRFDEKRESFLKQFDEHEVTKEIRRGPATRESILGYGNLFSLLGFNSDEHPVTALRAWLKQNIYLSKDKPSVETSNGKIFIRRNVIIPTLDEVNSATERLNPLDWANGRGWTELLEKGITGWNRFLSIVGRENDRKNRSRFDNPPSHSGTAIQVKTKNLREGKVGPISYVSGLLASFRASVSSNRR